MTTTTERRPWLSRTLVLLTLVSLTQDAASELMYPLLPVFLTGVLAAPPVLLGVVEGLADATAGVTKYVAGRWSDRRGRKPFIAAGYGLAMVGKGVVAAAAVWPVVLVGRVLDRFGKGVRSAPRDALIAESVPRESLGRAFGFHRMGDNAGAVIGPLLGLVALSAMGDDVRAAMWWALLPAAVSVALTFFVREPQRSPAVAAATATATSSATATTNATAPASADVAPVDRAPLPPEFRRVTALLVAIAVVNFSDALLLLRVLDLGHTTTEVVLAYVLFNAVNTLGAYPAGVLADRWPRHVVYSVGLAAFAVGYLGLAFVGRSGWVFVLVAVYGLFPAFTDGVGKAWIASLVPASRVGRAQGVYQSLNNGAVLVAGVWAGLLWNAGSGDGRVPLFVAGAVATLAALGMAMTPVRRSASLRRRPRTPRP